MTQIGQRTTGGIIKITVGDGGSKYASPPTVIISGGGGTGATAYAHMAGDSVESVVIGVGGTGFTASPTLSFQTPTAAVTISSFTAGTNSGTVTVGSTISATTWSSVTAGSSSASIVSFANATQFTIGATTFAASGAATLSAPGSGADATAYVYTGDIRPISFFKGRFNDLYGVDGMGRGIRWNGTDASVESLGLQKPAVGPVLSAASTNVDGFVSAVQIVAGGAGYHSPPTVQFTGGMTTGVTALGRAAIANGRVTGVTITERGGGYSSTPTVSFSGGIGTGASFGVGVTGAVSALRVTAVGSGYTTTPACTANSSSYQFSCANHGLTAGGTFYFTSLTGGSGLTTGTTYYAVTVAANTFTAATAAGTTAATNIFTSTLTSGVVVIPQARVEFSGAGITGVNANVTVGTDRRVSSASLLYGGTGATTTGVTASVVGGAGTGAAIAVDMSYTVASVTAVSSGSGFFTPPFVSVRASSTDTFGGGAALTSFVNTTGNVTGVSVVSGGQYAQPPTALIINTEAKAQATVSQNMRGKYKCAIRYLDDTPDTLFGPIPSSISELVEIDTGNAASGLTWTLSHYGLDDRVNAVELWRTTSDQSVILFRVATIERYINAAPNPDFSGTYTEAINDKDLGDAAREGFGLMPVTLPNGQINARRFGVPPGNFAVATMFQDRAWYAVDVTGDRPNTLLYSEMDEPESVPEENELIVQENTGEPDKIVGLLPLGGQLLIGQQAHLYALQYVAQPVLDASVLLVAYRGVLNSRCWDIIGGVAIIADGSGMYGFDGQNEDPLSVPVDNYWRTGIIDFTKSDVFHVRADQGTKTARFYYCRSGESLPTRALCFCVATKAWWEEVYPNPVTATCSSVVSGRVVPLEGLSTGSFIRSSGTSDSGTAIPYQMRTGNNVLVDEGGSRSVAVVYSPTDADSNLLVGLHFNNSSTPRPNAISTDRGDGFTTTAGGTAAVLNLNRNRSALGAANGFAQAHFSGRVDDRSAGGDRHVAVDVSGSQTSDAISLYAIRMTGAT